MQKSACTDTHCAYHREYYSLMCMLVGLRSCSAYGVKGVLSEPLSFLCGSLQKLSAAAVRDTVLSCQYMLSKCRVKHAAKPGCVVLLGVWASLSCDMTRSKQCMYIGLTARQSISHITAVMAIPSTSSHIADDHELTNSNGIALCHSMLMSIA